MSRRAIRKSYIEFEISRVRSLERRERNLFNSRQSDLTLIELPEPQFAGWERSFYIHPDFVHSSLSSILAQTLSLTQNVERSNRRDFAQRDYQHGRKLKPTEHRLNRIIEAKFHELNLSSDVISQFTPTIERDDRGHIQVWYEVKNPDRYISRIKAYYITHQYIPDSQALSELAWIDHKLYGPGYPYRHIIRLKGAYKEFDRHDRYGSRFDSEDYSEWQM